MANKEKLKQNRKHGIITPWEIMNGVQIPQDGDAESNSPIRRGRRHSSDSDSGVDVSIEGLIGGTKPPPPVKEPIICNLCSAEQIFESDERLWLHQKLCHMGKDCTKENVFPIRSNGNIDYGACELNVGPNMCNFEEAEKAKHQKTNSNHVWVCFECNPPKILVESKFNNHAEIFLHFGNILLCKDKAEADAEIQRRNMAT